MSWMTRSNIPNNGNYSGINGWGIADQEEKKIVLRLRFHCQDDSVRYLKMRRNARLSKLMKCYCEFQNLDFNKIVFFYSNYRLSPEETPDELNMKDEDQIEALIGWAL